MLWLWLHRMTCHPDLITNTWFAFLAAAIYLAVMEFTVPAIVSGTIGVLLCIIDVRWGARLQHKYGNRLRNALMWKTAIWVEKERRKHI